MRTCWILCLIGAALLTVGRAAAQPARSPAADSTALRPNANVLRVDPAHTDPLQVWPEGAPPRLVLRLTARPNPAEVGEGIILRAQLEPMEGLSAARLAQPESLAYRFHFGDGQRLDWTRHASVTHPYRTPGKYAAFVEVGRRGRTFLRSDTVVVEIRSRPVVELRANPQVLSVGESVRFAGGIDPVVPRIQHLIDFGDGSRPQPFGANTSYRYTRPGLYRAVLIVPRGRDTLRSEPVQIHVVKLQLTVDGTEPLLVNDAIPFRIRLEPPRLGYTFSLYPGDRSMYDGEGEGEAVIVHRYQEANSYRAFAVVRDASGRVLAASDTLPLKISAPVVHLRAHPSRVEAGASVRFTADLTPQVDGVTYRFHFGDGQEMTVPSGQVVHQYTEPVEVARAFVEVWRGAERVAPSDTVEITVAAPDSSIISDPPVVSSPRLLLEADRDHAGVGEGVRLTGRIDLPATGVEYQYDFGDGRVSGWQARADTVYVYRNPGTYRVVLAARADGQTIPSRALVLTVTEGTSPVWKWKWVLGGGAVLLFLVAGGFVLARRRASEPPVPLPGSVLVVKPQADPGNQQIVPGSLRVRRGEMRLLPVRDPGKQNLEAQREMIISEESSHASAYG